MVVAPLGDIGWMEDGLKLLASDNNGAILGCFRFFFDDLVNLMSRFYFRKLPLSANGRLVALGSDVPAW